MVKVTYAPWEEVIIHEVIQYSLEDLVKLRSLGTPAGGLSFNLLWAEGIAFVHRTMPTTPDIVKEQLQRKVHWSSVEFAPMPKYTNLIMIKESNVRVPVINVSNNPFLKTVAEWLGCQAYQKESKCQKI
ncbi:MAG: hypothetical protein L6M37_07025 [Candidatus Methylarchaceae archaeon HK02M1]|nr:hypothetical protein [Candidatus Methylarchaceae archaeon HK01M]MCP8312682.1 hypothetical protein [Candidatus Methylarchaceae archaeon HK02M1]